MLILEIQALLYLVSYFFNNIMIVLLVNFIKKKMIFFKTIILALPQLISDFY